MLTDNVILEKTQEVCEVVKKYRGYDEIDMWTKILIKNSAGVIKQVSMEDVLVPFNLEQKNSENASRKEWKKCSYVENYS